MSRSMFIQIYSSLPEDIRREIIAVIGNKPYTWDAAYIEVEKNTELGKKILIQMENLGLINNGK